MVHNEKKLEQATQFRKRGFSYSEIAKICGISKATLSNWFGKKAFSKKVKKYNVEKASRENGKRVALLNKAKEKERLRRYEEALKSAQVSYKHFRSNSLFTAGLMLYRSNGDMTASGIIRLTTADITSHRIFSKFTREYLGVEKKKIHFWLLLYPTHSEKTCVQKWTKELRISTDQWYKNQVVQSRSKNTSLHHGVGNIIIGDTVLKKTLLLWLERASKELGK